MNRSRSSITRLLAVLASLLVLSALALPATAAQDAPEEIGFTIGSFSCDSDPGQVSLAADNLPGDCTPDAGISFQVALEDGTAVGTCTTDDGGICNLQVPNEATVTVTMDAAPAGSAPRENPITTQAVTEFAGALFINLPVAAEPTTPAEPTLPSTGSGPHASSDTATFALAAMSTAALLCAAAALAVRRQEA